MAFSDSMGRNFGGGSDDLAKALLGNVGNLNNLSQAAADVKDRYKDMAKALNRLNNNFLPEFENTIRDLNQAVKSLSKGGKKNETNKSEEYLFNIMNMTEKLWNCICKSTQLSPHEKTVMKAEKTAAQQAEKQKKKPTSTNAAAAGGSGGSGGGGGGGGGTGAAGSGSGGGGGGGKKRNRRFKYDDDEDRWVIKILDTMQTFRQNVEETMFGFQEKTSLAMMAIDGNLLNLIKHENNFAVMAKEAAYEVGGITAETRGLQQEYMNIGKQVGETGMSRMKYQEEYLKNLRAGIKDMKVAQSITKQSLFAERQLGLKAGELSEHFRDMNLSGKTNVAQTSEMARGMLQTARNTGLTGENLKKAVSESGNFVTNMKNAATLTASAANNVLEIVANAQKLGVSKAVTPLLEAATSSANLIMNSSQQTQALLYNAAGSMGRIAELQQGTLLRSKQGIKDLGQGMENVLKQFGVDSLEAVEHLPDEMKMKLNIQLKAAFGVELGELTRTIEATREAGKGLSERLDEINKKRQLNLNLEEKNALLQQETSLKTNAALSALTGLSEAAKGAKSMDEALSRFEKRSGEFAADVAAFGGDASSSGKIAESSLKEAVKNLDKELTKIGEKTSGVSEADIAAALKEGPEQFQLVMDRINKANQTLATAQKAAVDPVTQTAQTLEKYNEYFKDDYAAPMLEYTKGIFGATGAMAIAMTLMGSQFLLWGSTLSKSLGLGGGAAKTAGAAASTAGSAAGAAGKAAGSAATGAGGAMGAAAAGAMPVPPAPNTKAISMDWKSMMGHLKTLAVGLVGVVTAVAAIGLAIIAIGAIVQTVDAALQMDPLELALKVTKIIVAATIIATEVMLVFKGLELAAKAFESTIKPASLIQIGKFALVLVAVTAAIVGLASAILYIANFMTFGLDAAMAEEIAIKVTTIIGGAVIVVAACAAAAAAMIGIAIGLGKLIALMGKFAPLLLLLPFVLPAFVGIIVGTAAAIFWAADKIMKGAGLTDTAYIEDLIYRLNLITWGIAAFMTGLAAASLVMVGAGVLVAVIAASTVGWLAMAAGIGVIIGIGYAIAKIVKGIIAFMDSMKDVSAEDIKANTDKALMVLDSVYKVLLRLAPLFLLIVGAGVAAALAVKYGLLAAPYVKAFLAAAALFVFFGPYLAASLTKLMIAINDSVLAVVKDVKFNPEETKKNVEKLEGISGATKSILMSLLPILATMAIIGFLVVKALPIIKMAAIGLAVASAIALLLPVIASGIALLMISIVEAVNSVMAGTSLDKAKMEAMTERLKAIADTIWSLTKTFGFMALIGTLAVINFTAAKLVLKGVNSTLGKVIPQIQILGQHMVALQQAFSGISAAQMQDLALKMQFLADAIGALSSAMWNIFKLSWTMPKPAKVTAMSESLNGIKEPLQGFLNSLTGISLIVYQMSLKFDLERVKKAFNDIAAITQAMTDFMTKIKDMQPGKEMQKASKEMLKKNQLSKPLAYMLLEIKNVLGVIKAAKLNRKDLIMANEVFKILGEFSTNMQTSMEGMKKASEVLSPKGFFGQNVELVDSKVVKENLNKFLGIYEDLLDTLAEKAETLDLEKAYLTAAYLEKMATIMSMVQSALEKFTGVAKIMIEQTDRGWWWWGQSNVDKLTEVTEVGGKKINQFGRVVGVMTDAFDTTVTEMMKHGETAQKATAAQTILAKLDETLGSFFKTAENIGKTLISFFYDGWWTDGVGKQLSDSAVSIAFGMRQFFLALNAVRDTTGSADVGSYVKTAQDLTNMAQALTQMAVGLNQFTDIAAKMVDNFKKAPAYKFMSDDAVYNEYIDQFGKLKYVGIMAGHIVGSLKNGIQEGFGGDAGGVISQVNSALQQIATVPPVVNNAVDQINKLFSINLPTEEQTEQIKKMAEGMKRLLTAVGAIATAVATHEVFGSADFTGAAEKLKLVTSVLDPITESVAKFSEYAVFQSTMSYGVLSEKNTKPLEMAAKGVGLFMNAMGKIVEEVKNSGAGDANDFSDTIKRLNGMNQIVVPIANILELFSKQLGPLTKAASSGDWSVAEQVKQSAGKVSEAIGAVGTMISGIKDASSLVPDKEGSEAMMARIKGIGDMAGAVKNVLESLHSIMTVISDNKTLGDKSLIESVNEMAKQMELGEKENPIVSIFKFMNNGIFKPLMTQKFDSKTFWEAEDYEEAGKMLKGMGAAMKGLKEMLQSMNGSLIAIAGVGLKAGQTKDSVQKAEKIDLKNTKTELGLAVKYLEAAMPQIKQIFGFLGQIIETMYGKGGAFEKYSVDDVLDAADTLKGMAEIFKVLGGDGTNKGLMHAINMASMELAGTVAQGEGKIAPVNNGQTEKAISNLANIRGLKSVFEKMAPLLADIVGVRYLIPYSTDDILDAADTIKGIGTMIEYLPKIMSGVKDALPKMIESNKGIDASLAAKTKNLPAQKETLATIFANTGIFLGGIVDAVLANFDSAEDVQLAAQIVPAMISMADTIANNGPLLVDAASKIMAMPPIGVIDPKKAFGYVRLFQVIGLFANSLLNAGLETVTENITQAAEQVSGVDQAIQGLINALSGLGGSMVNLGNMGAALQGGVNVTANVQATTNPSPEAQRRQVARTVDMAGVSSAAISAATENNIEHIATATMTSSSRLGEILDMMREAKAQANAATKATPPPQGYLTYFASALDATTLPDSDSTNTANFGY
jgi:hypothetical protein